MCFKSKFEDIDLKRRNREFIKFVFFNYLYVLIINGIKEGSLVILWFFII